MPARPLCTSTLPATEPSAAVSSGEQLVARRDRAASAGGAKSSRSRLSIGV